MAKHHDPRGQDKKIAAAIRAQIMSGDLAPGARLPITQQLMETYGVANQTVQRALKILKDEGFVIGRSGSGVFVRDTSQQAIDSVATMWPSAPGTPYTWITEAAKGGQVGTNKILDVAEVEPPHQVREALNIHPGGTAALRHRLLLLDDEPAELVWSYYPIDLARGTALLQHERIKGGSPTLLAELGFPPREMVDRVTWRPPTEDEFVLLELPAEVPVGRTFRVVYSDNSRPIEATIMVKSGHRHELLYRVPLI